MLRALQDDSLGWLANVPIEGLVELRRNREHAELREELKKCTAQLTAAGRADLESVTKEVRHGLQVLIQKQQKAIKDIEDKYSSKKWGVFAAAGAGAIAGASMTFMPAVAALFGVSAPVASLLGAAGTGGTGWIKELASRAVDRRNARKSMMGMLAVAQKSVTQRS